jgi:tyrosine-protein kinase Etk/Wzc
MNQATNKGEDVSLIDYLIVLAKHSRLILYTSAAVALLVLLVLLFIPNKYTARARIMPPQSNMTLSAQLMDSLGGIGIPGGRSRLGETVGNLLGIRQPGNLYVGIMSGESLENRIIERFDLRKIYRKKFIEDARRVLRERINVGIGERDAIIFIDATDVSPQRAADLANAYVEELDKLLNVLGHQEAKARFAFLEKERLKVKNSLSQAEESLRTFSEKFNVVQIDAQAKGVIEYLANLKAAIDAKEVELKVLRQKATPMNYDVIRLETEIKGLKEKLNILESQESLNPRVGDTLIAASRMPAVGKEFLQLYRELKYQEGLYKTISQLTEIARLDIARDVGIIYVIDKAAPPEKKSSPKILSITFFAVALTFVIMVISAFFVEYWHNVFDPTKEPIRYQHLQSSFREWRHDYLRLRDRLRRKRPF